MLDDKDLIIAGLRGQVEALEKQLAAERAARPFPLQSIVSLQPYVAPPWQATPNGWPPSFIVGNQCAGGGIPLQPCETWNVGASS